MRVIKIKDLPDGPWREYALEAQRRGIEIVGADILNGTDITLIGAIDMIRELTEKIEKKTE